MNKVNENDKDCLKAILEELIDTIDKIIEEDDFYILQENKDKADEWLTNLISCDNEDDLEELGLKVKDSLYHQFGEPLSESALDEKRIDLMCYYIEKSNEILGIS